MTMTTLGRRGISALPLDTASAAHPGQPPVDPFHADRLDGFSDRVLVTHDQHGPESAEITRTSAFHLARPQYPSSADCRQSSLVLCLDVALVDPPASCVSELNNGTRTSSPASAIP